jgi:hypothetical protein
MVQDEREWAEEAGAKENTVINSQLPHKIVNLWLTITN